MTKRGENSYIRIVRSDNIVSQLCRF
ncbi:hypothetical protein F01_200219 [Burkholderia cenocepacia]|nr:hypothetical protein F01_200219 [Burkholderia cenocepacia]